VVVDLSVTQVDLHPGDDLLRGRPFLFEQQQSNSLVYLFTEFFKLMMRVQSFYVTNTIVIWELTVLWILQLGTALSIYGCSRFADENAIAGSTDTELGANYSARGMATKPSLDEGDGAREIAGSWGYLLQIVYQVKEAATPPNGLKCYPHLGSLLLFLIG
jgi:hypothetical protein